MGSLTLNGIGGWCMVLHCTIFMFELSQIYSRLLARHANNSTPLRNSANTCSTPNLTTVSACVLFARQTQETFASSAAFALPMKKLPSNTLKSLERAMRPKNLPSASLGARCQGSLPKKRCTLASTESSGLLLTRPKSSKKSGLPFCRA